MGQETRLDRLCLGICIILCSVVVVSSQTGAIQLTFDREEELPVGTSVGNIAAESDLTANPYTYNFVNKVEDIVKYFNLTTDGMLYIALKIDRENITSCKFQITCVLNFDILASYNDEIKWIKVTVSVLDINDNSPTFDHTEVSIDLSELYALDKDIHIDATPTDLDKGVNNSIAAYDLVPQNSIFRLKVDTSNADPKLSLILNTSLDYEKEQTHVLYIKARDNGTPKRTGTLTVTINVVDENDHDPIFENPNPNITVTEDWPLGKSIISVKAKDADSGEYGRITYSLTETVDQLFKVNATTGALLLAKKLEYEKGKENKIIKIKANDHGVPERSATATVHLEILDAGNNPPQVQISLQNEVRDGVCSVKEDAIIDFYVAFVSVSDTDSNQNGNVSCSAFSTYFGLQKYFPGYKVVVQHKLDREQLAEHEVTVTCRDYGTPSLKTTKSFKVEVEDVNDNRPSFNGGTFIFNVTNIREGNNIGQKIIQITATDADIGENGRVSYAVPDEFRDQFSIDSSGTVKSLIDLDRETTPEKPFKILAMDHGKSPSTSTADIVLYLQDANDNAPTFAQMIQPFKIEENLDTNTLVNSVTAVDKDLGKNKELFYYMAPEYRDRVPFTVTADGQIITTWELDRENISIYHFNIVAQDRGEPPLKTAVKVAVEVQDINDNHPQFLFPVKGNRSVTALNVVSADQPITEIRAFDRDTGINSELMYLISGGNSDEIFALDQHSGRLYIVKYVHITGEVTHSLNILVEDKGNPTRENSSTLMVTLQYSNATTLATVADAPNNNVVIVVSVVCVTVLLSIAIITIICLIRRRDLLKCGPNGIKFPAGGNRKQRETTVHQDGNEQNYLDAQQLKGKKEVSFSEDSFSSNDFKTLESLHMNGKVQVLSPLMAFEDTSKQLEIKAPPGILRQTDTQKMFHHQREDSHSEGSGESGDSGNGGSEIDGPSHETLRVMDTMPQIQEKKSPEIYTIASPQDHAQPLYSTINKNNKNHNNNSTKDFHRPYHQYSEHYSHNSNPDRGLPWRSNSEVDSCYNSYNSNPLVNQYSDQKLWLQVPPTNSSRVHHAPLGYNNYGYTNSSFNYGTLSSSAREDDDKSSTSGSYTINPEDWNDDPDFMDQSRLPRDLVV